MTTVQADSTPHVGDSTESKVADVPTVTANAPSVPSASPPTAEEPSEHSSTAPTSIATTSNVKAPVNPASEGATEANNDVASSEDDEEEESPVDESQLTPAALEALREARRAKARAKEKKKKEKKKAMIEAAKKRKREENEAKQKTSQSSQKQTADRNVKPKTNSISAPASTMGLAAILNQKILKDSAPATKSSIIASQTSAASASAAGPSSSSVASSAASASPAPSSSPSPAPSSSPSFGMTLDQWRAMSASRPELSMSVTGEDARDKQIADRRVEMESTRLTGIGGGYKAHEGWECQSKKCTGHVNFKNDTVCKKCGAARRY